MGEDRGDLVEVSGHRWVRSEASEHGPGTNGKFLPSSPLLPGIEKRPLAPRTYSGASLLGPALVRRKDLPV